MAPKPYTSQTASPKPYKPTTLVSPACNRDLRLRVSEDVISHAIDGTTTAEIEEIKKRKEPAVLRTHGLFKDIQGCLEGYGGLEKIVETATLFDGCGCRFSLEAFVYILWVWQFLARGIDFEVQNRACSAERGLRLKGSSFETLKPKPKTAPLEGKPPSSSVGF